MFGQNLDSPKYGNTFHIIAHVEASEHYSERSLGNWVGKRKNG